MIWPLTLVYFTFSSIVICVGFLVYAKLLLFFGKFGYIGKYVGGTMCYVLFACFLVSPLFYGLYIEAWRLAFNLNVVYMLFFMVCYLLSLVPGGLFFKKHYLQKLRALGYFKARKGSRH